MVKRGARILGTVTIWAGFAAVAAAEPPPAWREGRITTFWADPSDTVLSLDTAGPCGSSFFHVQRSNANFTELTALMMTAAASSKHVHLYVESCNNDRNIISHGAADF